jgi:5'(3')-deoxyribonucleotidase
MCNCKGWDIAYYPDEITVEQHFCRVYGDCGHVDNTLEEAADKVTTEYDKQYDWYCDNRNRDLVEITNEKLDWFLEQSRAWRNRTHASYIYYKGEN